MLDVGKLWSCDCPFLWSIRWEIKKVPDDMIRRFTDQLNKRVFEEEFHFEHLMLYVGLAYENSVANETEKAFEVLETGEKKLQELGDYCSSNIDVALRHIILSTKAHLFHKKGDFEGTAQVLSKITPIDKMDKRNDAALNGLRAVFLSEYSIGGLKIALGYASKAIELNPNEPFWYFLKGKLIWRVRRVECPYDVPQLEERETLEKAINFEKNPSFMVYFTAQLYGESANRMFHLNNRSPPPREKANIFKLNEKALQFYDESIQMKPTCPNMMFRVAKGYMLMPPLFLNLRLEKAEALLEEGLKITPRSGYGNYVMGQYYERVKKQPEEAQKYLAICESKKIFEGTMDLVRLEYQMDNGTDLPQRLNALLQDYPEKRRKCQLLSQMISYYLLVSTDVEKACSLASEVMQLELNCKDMTKHRPLTLSVPDPINLYDVLIDDVNIQMQGASDEEKMKYRMFLVSYMLTEKRIPSGESRHLKDSILAKSTQRNMFIPKNHNVSMRREFQKPAHFRIQPDEGHSLNFNRWKFGQRQEDSSSLKSNSDASAYNWCSRPSQEISSEPPQESRKGNVMKGAETTSTTDAILSSPKRDESEDSDSEHFKFYQMIHEKSQKKSGTVRNSEASEPIDLVAPVQIMKISDETSDSFEIISVQGVRALPTKTGREGSKRSEPKPPAKSKNVDPFTERKNVKGEEDTLPEKKHFNDSNRRSKYHEKYGSEYSRRKTYARGEESDAARREKRCKKHCGRKKSMDSNDDSGQRRKSKRSHRGRRDYSSDDEEERRHRDHRSSKYCCTQYSRRRRSSSESKEDSNVERRSMVSKRRDHRSLDQGSERSYRRNPSEYEEDRRERRRDYWSPEHESRGSRREIYSSQSADSEGDRKSIKAQGKRHSKLQSVSKLCNYIQK